MVVGSSSPAKRPPGRRAVRSTRRRRSWVSVGVSSATVMPARPGRSIVSTRSAIVRASSWSWVTSSAVVAAARRMAASSGARRSCSSRSRPGQRLVEQQRRGDGASDRASATRLASPPLSVGHRPALEAGESDEGEHLGRRGVARAGRRQPLHPQPELDVGGDVAVREQLLVLEHHPDAAAVRRHVGDVDAVELIVPGLGREQAGDRPAAACSCRCPTARAGRPPRRRRSTATRRRARGVRRSRP